MEEVKSVRANYHVFEFMRSLGLTGNVLNVYALLYSFTRSQAGLYYGSQETLANMLGISLRTVQRAYRELYRFGYIEKTRVGKFSGVKCTHESVNKNKDGNARKREQPSETARGGERGQGEAKKEILSRRIDSASNGARREIETSPIVDSVEGVLERRDVRVDYYRNPDPKYKLHYFGRHKHVAMTGAQYAELCALIEPEWVEYYIARCDCMVDKNIENPINAPPPPHSYYRTIRSWIHKDFGT